MGMEGTVMLRVIAAMDFGKQMMVEYAVENIMSGKTTDQIKQISAKLRDVQYLLSSGSLYAALDELQKVQTDLLVTESIKQKYILKLRTYLGV